MTSSQPAMSRSLAASTLAWLYHVNHGVFMTPGVDEQWTLSVAHTDEDLGRYVDAFELFARDVTAG